MSKQPVNYDGVCRGGANDGKRLVAARPDVKEYNRDGATTRVEGIYVWTSPPGMWIWKEA